MKTPRIKLITVAVSLAIVISLIYGNRFSLMTWAAAQGSMGYLATLAEPILPTQPINWQASSPEKDSKADRSPNIIVILADDLGWNDISFYGGGVGSGAVQTPNIDRLAHEGMKFTDHYSGNTVCSPSRACLMTGQHSGRVHCRGNGDESVIAALDPSMTTLPRLFKNAGYATGAFGKWHNGMQYPYHPNGRGFEEYYGFCSGHWGDYFSPPLDHNGKIVKGNGFCIDDFTDKAMAFMEQSSKAGKPFFAYIPYNTPHSPMQVPDRFWNKFKDKEIKLRNRDPRRENLAHLRCALAMCENIDWNVGRLLKKLDQLGVAEDTIVLFFHDNGPNGVRWNGGMKGRKGSTDETHRSK